MDELAGRRTDDRRETVSVLRAPGAGLLCPMVFTSNAGVIPLRHSGDWLLTSCVSSMQVTTTAVDHQHPRIAKKAQIFAFHKRPNFCRVSFKEVSFKEPENSHDLFYYRRRLFMA